MDTVDRIFDLLDKMPIEQQEFAKRVGVSDDTASNWRRRKSASYSKYLSRIAEVLGTSVEYLLTGKKEEPAPAPSGGDELVNAIIMGRDGKAVKRTYTKEQMEALRKVIDVMPYLDDEEL